MKTIDEFLDLTGFEVREVCEICGISRQGFWRRKAAGWLCDEVNFNGREVLAWKNPYGQIVIDEGVLYD